MIDRIIDPNVAANAYTNSSNVGQNGVSGDDGVSFADFLQDSIQSSIATLKSGEAAAAAGVTGQGDPINVVQAVNAADLTLQTVVAIRDRLVSAYQEIARMPI